MRLWFIPGVSAGAVFFLEHRIEAINLRAYAFFTDSI